MYEIKCNKKVNNKYHIHLIPKPRITKSKRLKTGDNFVKMQLRVIKLARCP